MISLRNPFQRHLAQTSATPDGLEVSHGNGIYLFDIIGNQYIDAISGISVSSLGHGHPGIMEAIKKQLDTHLHTHVYGEHIIAPQVKLATRLASLLPPQLDTVYFTNSGAESVEGAMKLVKKFTHRHDIVACRKAYHGSTAGAESLRSDLEHTSSSRPLIPGIVHIDFNAEEELEKITSRTAGVFIEPIQAEAGAIMPSNDYLKKVRQRCDETGALLVLDEIQTGMGRTGTLWRFEAAGVLPDVLLLAKAFGGGLPLGAFISNQKIMNTLSHNPPLGHLTTFGGNAVSCAAGLAALNIITEQKLHLRALTCGRIIRELLEHHSAIKEFRGAGLLLAIDLKEARDLSKAIKACRAEGVLVDFFLFNDRSIRLAPPLIMTDDEAYLLGEKIRRALDTL